MHVTVFATTTRAQAQNDKTIYACRPTPKKSGGKRRARRLLVPNRTAVPYRIIPPSPSFSQPPSSPERRAETVAVTPPRAWNEGSSMGDRQSSRRATMREFCRLFVARFRNEHDLAKCNTCTTASRQCSRPNPHAELLIGAVWMNGSYPPPQPPWMSLQIAKKQKHAYLHVGFICCVELLWNLLPQVQMERETGGGGAGLPARLDGYR